MSEPGIQEEHPAHPEVAIVLIAHQGGLRLTSAVQGLAEVARTFGVHALVMLPADAPEVPRPTSLPLAVQVVEVPADTPESTWRARALAETSADVLVFVDDRRAAAMPWEDLVPYRLGLVRSTVTAAGDLAGTLTRLGVLPPGGASAMDGPA